MPLPDSAGVDIPRRAQHARLKQILTKEWGIMPWEYHKLSMRDIQDIRLAEHTEAYIQHEQQQRQQNGGMRSTRNSDSYQEYQDEMKERFGGVQ